MRREPASQPASPQTVDKNAVGYEYHDMAEGQGNEDSSTKPSNTSRSGYALPVSPLITRNLSYVLNPINLPCLPIRLLRRECLLSSVPFTTEGVDLPIKSADVLEQYIRTSVPFNSQQWKDTIELMQALALVVATPAGENAAASTTATIQDRLLLASCYTVLDQLPKARTVLEVAREEARANRDASASKQVLLAIANVAALQRNHDDEAKRFLRWYVKAVSQSRTS